MGPGAYPALALHFPALATPAQRERGEAGVTLEFVVDTAARARNTISAAVCSGYNHRGDAAHS